MTSLVLRLTSETLRAKLDFNAMPVNVQMDHFPKCDHRSVAYTMASEGREASPAWQTLRTVPLCDLFTVDTSPSQAGGQHRGPLAWFHSFLNMLAKEPVAWTRDTFWGLILLPAFEFNSVFSFANKNMKVYFSSTHKGMALLCRSFAQGIKCLGRMSWEESECSGRQCVCQDDIPCG